MNERMNSRMHYQGWRCRHLNRSYCLLLSSPPAFCTIMIKVLSTVRYVLLCHAKSRYAVRCHMMFCGVILCYITFHWIGYWCLFDYHFCVLILIFSVISFHSVLSDGFLFWFYFISLDYMRKMSTREVHPYNYHMYVQNICPTMVTDSFYSLKGLWIKVHN